MLYCTALNFDFLHCVLLVLCTTILYVLIFVYVRHSRSESSAKKITGSRFADDCISQFQIRIQDPAKIIADKFTYFNFFFILYDNNFFWYLDFFVIFVNLCKVNILITEFNTLNGIILKKEKKYLNTWFSLGLFPFRFFFRILRLREKSSNEKWQKKGNRPLIFGYILINFIHTYLVLYGPLDIKI